MELQRLVRREEDALSLARDVVKQLEGISSLDQKALAEVQRLLHTCHWTVKDTDQPAFPIQ